MSSRERKVSPEEVQKVQNLIEQYLSHYMNKNQVIDILYRQQNIEPMFTKLVWERLEEENQQFFQIYKVMLMSADQIRQYNHLLQKQYEVNTPGVVSNGSHIPALPENNGVVMKTENMHHPTPAVVRVHGGFNNFGPFTESEMHHGPYNMLVGPNLNGVGVSGPGYLGDSKFVYQGHGNGMESQPPVSSFRIMDSVPNQFNGTVIDDTRSFQLLRQLSQSITWSDSTADFTNVPGETDISRNFDFQKFDKDS